jgi:hypothetical protein
METNNFIKIDMDAINQQTKEIAGMLQENLDNFKLQIDKLKSEIDLQKQLKESYKIKTHSDILKICEEVYTDLETGYAELELTGQKVALNNYIVHYARISQVLADLKDEYNKRYLQIMIEVRDREKENKKITETYLKELVKYQNDYELIHLENVINRVELLLKAISKAIDSCRTIISASKIDFENSKHLSI